MDLSDLRVKLGADTDDLDGELASAEGKVTRFVDGLKVAGAAAGAALGTTLAAGFAKNLEIDAAQGKLNAQLGLTGQRAEEFGRVAADLYAGAWGESLGQVNEALRGVMQSGLVMEDASTQQIQNITAKVLDLATAFDQDLGAATAAVGQLMKTGLAADAETALDIITRGFQQGVDVRGDFLDTLVEYSTQFRKLGLDATAATGLLSQGLKAGARDADVVADSLKEFSIRAIDGSKLTAEGFEMVGLSADEMAAKIAAGGPEASAALDLTLDRLRAIEDPVTRDAAAVALFGTQAEDLGAALYALDPSSAVQQLGNVAGATDRTREALATSQEQVTAMQRSVELWTASLVTADGPLGDVSTAVVAFGADAVGMAGSAGMAVLAMRGLGLTAVASAGRVALAAGMTAATSVASLAVTAAAWTSTAAVATLSAARMALAWVMGVGLGAAAAVAGMVVASTVMVARWVWMGAQAMLQAARMAAAWIVAMGPVGWVIAAVVGLAALIIAHWDKIKASTGAAKDWILRKLGELLNWIRGLPGRIRSAVGDLGSLLWDAGSSLVSGLWGGIQAAGSWLYGKIMGWIRSVVPGPILNFLGISSPSRWAEREVGRWIGPGLAEGILAGSGPAERAARQLAAGVGGALGGGLSGSGRAAQEILDHLSRGGRVFEDFSFRGASGLVGKHNDQLAAAYRASGATDPRRWLAGYVASQRGGSAGAVIRIEAGGSQLDKLLLEVLRRAIRGQGGNVQRALGS